MKKIILFGAGEYGIRALDYYGKDRVECFADNSQEKTGSSIEGKKVISFSELLDIHYSYDVVVSANGANALQIIQQLCEEDIFCTIFCIDMEKQYLNINLLLSKMVHSRLQDEMSRIIFENRIMRLLTGDESYIKKLICYTAPEFSLLLDKLGSNKLLLCDTSTLEKSFAGLFKEIVRGYMILNTESKNSETLIQGLPSIPINDVEKQESYGDIFVLPFTNDDKTRIIQELHKRKIPDNRIFDPAPYVKIKDAYFDLPHLQAVQDEVFIDGGAYDGDTSICFIKWLKHMGRKSGKVYAFEPELARYEECKKNLAGIPDITLINAGLWDKKDVLSFLPMDGGGSKISDSGNERINVVSLDEQLGDKRVTFIKMDIEGAELAALKGCEQIIKKQKPKLAISVYHNPEDILMIPEFILKLRPSYKFYLRHYTLGRTDTVLYAI